MRGKQEKLLCCPTFFLVLPLLPWIFRRRATREEEPENFLRQYTQPLILDEIQYAPKIFRYLKRTIDEQRHSMGRFLMTGSRKFPLMAAVNESLPVGAR